MQRKFTFEVGTEGLRNTYSQFREWLKRTYGGYYITEEEKKSTMDIVDEQISIEFNAQ